MILTSICQMQNFFTELVGNFFTLQTGIIIQNINVIVKPVWESILKYHHLHLRVNKNLCDQNKSKFRTQAKITKDIHMEKISCQKKLKMKIKTQFKQVHSPKKQLSTSYLQAQLHWGRKQHQSKAVTFTTKHSW